MTDKPRIIDLDEAANLIVIRWEDGVEESHWIPSEILKEGVTTEEVDNAIAALRNPARKSIVAPEALKTMVETQPEVLAEQAKSLRDGFLKMPVEYPRGENTWYLIDDGFKEIYFDALLSGVADTEGRNWRLADNTWRFTTLGDMKAIMGIQRTRKEVMWAQFNAWDQGPKDQPFEYVDPQ